MNQQSGDEMWVKPWSSSRADDSGMLMIDERYFRLRDDYMHVVRAVSHGERTGDALRDLRLDDSIDRADPAGSVDFPGAPAPPFHPEFCEAVPRPDSS